MIPKMRQVLVLICPLNLLNYILAICFGCVAGYVTDTISITKCAFSAEDFAWFMQSQNLTTR